MGKRGDGGSSADDAGWFSEGMAEFYACFIPGRFGLRDRGWVRRVANGMLSAYYTNPLVGVGNKEAAERAGKTAHAARLAYKRGFTHLVKADHRLRDLSSHLGSKVVNEYYGIAAGELVVPAEECLAREGLSLVRRDQEVFQLWFQEESFNERVIVGLEEGSRAQKAGLREGDRLLRNGYLWQVCDEFEREMRVVVARKEEGRGEEGEEEAKGEDGEGRKDEKKEREVEVKIRFWPRGWEKVECWQWVIE